MDAQNLIAAINSSPTNKGVDGAEWLADWQSNPHNICMEFGKSFVLFDGKPDGVYEVHFLFDKGLPGRSVIDLSKLAFDLLFEENPEAELIMGLVPDDLAHAKLHARLVGGKSIGTRDTPYGFVELFVLSREMWEDRKTNVVFQA